MEEDFWDRIKDLIKAHRISQKKFAEHIDIPYHTFKGWIYHGRIPGGYTTCKIAEGLGVTMEYLIRGVDDINAEERIRLTTQRKSAAEQIQKLVRRIDYETEKL